MRLVVASMLVASPARYASLDLSAQVASARGWSRVRWSAVTFLATMTGAQFGAFFYNRVDDKGEAYTLNTISDVPREAFSKFPMPRNTPLFAPRFYGEGTVLSDDITADPRHGTVSPFDGMCRCVDVWVR